MQISAMQMRPESVRVETGRLTLRIEEHRDEWGQYYEAVYLLPAPGAKLEWMRSDWRLGKAQVHVVSPGEENSI